MPVIPAPGRQKQEDLEFKSNLGYIIRSYLKIYTPTKTNTIIFSTCSQEKLCQHCLRGRNTTIKRTDLYTEGGEGDKSLKNSYIAALTYQCAKSREGWQSQHWAIFLKSFTAPHTHTSFMVRLKSWSYWSASLAAKDGHVTQFGPKVRQQELLGKTSMTLSLFFLT